MHSDSARWTYAEGGLDYSAAWRAARDAILEAFGDHYSPSVQFTLRRMGRAVLKAVDAIDRVRLSLPNRHHLLYDLSRFGLENPNEVFHATTEPYGLIEGTVERGSRGPQRPASTWWKKLSRSWLKSAGSSRLMA